MSSDNTTEHDLPDDVNRWPVDPESLLGVASDVSRRDLKRAYSRLIRKFKPEHFPEQFRRLRDAYDHLDNELEWKEEFLLRAAQQAPANDAPEISDPLDQDTLVADQADDAAQSINEGVNSQGDSNSDLSDQLWQRALDGGDLQTVYSGLREQALFRNPSEIEYARLYWLLTLQSDLDVDRDPCSYLIDGLKHHGFRSRLFTMLEIDVRRRGGRVPVILDHMLTDGNPPARNLVDLVGTRWFAARRQGRFDVIGEDFSQLRRILLDEPDEWLRLLNIALRTLILVYADPLLESCREELSQVPETSAHNWIWDMLEQNIQLHDAWKQVPEVVVKLPHSSHELLQSLRALVQETWDMTPAEARTSVLQFCQYLLEAPQSNLKELGRICAVSRPLVRRFLELIRDQQTELNLDRETELTPALDAALKRFTRMAIDRGDDSPIEFAVLKFCMREVVTPRDLAMTLNRMQDEVPDPFFETTQNYMNSLSLHCLVEADRLLCYAV